MLLPKRIKNKLLKISKNFILKKYHTKKYDFFINNKKQNVIAYKIKNNQEIKYKIEGFNELDETIVYYYSLKTDFFYNKINAEIDLICTNSNSKIIGLYKNFDKYKSINLKDSKFIWITKRGFIDYYELKINDFISTHSIKDKIYILEKNI